jgi:cytochrome c-type biogenesis protein CcmH
MFSLRRWIALFAQQGEEGIPQGRPKAEALGCQPFSSSPAERPKAEALGYLEATAHGAVSGGHSIRRWMQAGVICLLAVVMLGADPSSRFDKVGHQMMCVCGCGQVLLECNHVGCPDSDRMIGELRAQMSGGGSDTSILNWFAAKYGATVLAAPIRGGFDNVAWITPMAVFLLATFGLGFLIRMWTVRRGVRAPVSAAGPDVGEDALRERIRRETEY